MIERLFLNVVEITLSTSWVILPLVLFSSLLKKKYTAKWSYTVWLIIAMRLILPINFELPQSAFSITIPNDFSPSITEAYTNAKDNLSKKLPINAITSKETSEEIDPDNPYNITSCFANGNGLDVFSKSPTDENNFELKQLFSLKSLSFLWILGVFLFLSYQYIGYFFFKRSVKRWSWPVTGENTIQTLKDITEELELKKTLPLFGCRLISSPMVIGLINPILLLPETYSYLNNISAILKHELIHYKRKDILYKILLTLANAVHWFNPLVYLMAMEANKDLEFYCDEEVVGNMDINYRYEYSSAILSVMGTKTNQNTILSTNFNGNIDTMKKRFKNILNLNPKCKGRVSLPLILTVVLTSSTLIACDNISPTLNPLNAKAIEYLKSVSEIKIDYEALKNNTLEVVNYDDDNQNLIKYVQGDPFPMPYHGYTLELADIEIINPKMLNEEDMTFDFKANAIIVYGNGLLRSKPTKGSCEVDVQGDGYGISVGQSSDGTITPYVGNFQNPPTYLLPDYNKEKQVLTIVNEYTSSKKLCAAYMKALIGHDFTFIGLNTAHVLTTMNIDYGQQILDSININRIKIIDSKERLAKGSNDNSKAYYKLELDVKTPGDSSLKKGENIIWLYMCAKNNEGTDQWIVQQVSKDGPPSKEWWSSPVNFQ